ncbi:MAG: hypothetical protein M4579_000475 [Chaenotheca gracillima]|nr:MAG: hypothetical protein M4579_000475 [Chaenotheca gracillima]
MAAGCAGYMMSPIYKGLTIQFKVFVLLITPLNPFLLSSSSATINPTFWRTTVPRLFLQMSAMAVGGGIEADRGLRIYERRLRMERRERSIRRDEEAWRKFEERYPEGQQQMLKQSSEGDEKPTQDST